MSWRRKRRTPGSGRRHHEHGHRDSAGHRPAAHSNGRHRAVIAAAIVFCALAGILAFQHWRPAGTGTIDRKRDNILLVTLDTTRADRLGAYGYARARTAHFDRLAAEGVRFEHAFSPAPITLPAHASLFTGRFPFEHGVRNNGNFYLPDTFDTLATILSKQGYRTGAFVSSFVLDRRYGLARGFDEYDDRMQGGSGQVVSLEAERRGDRTALALSAWLDRQETTVPFFAWLHLYDPHEPYRPPNPFRDAFLDSPYDGEIAFTDAIVASIVDKLRQRGLLERTLITIVGDHGESLGDHGEETHSMFVYEAAIRIPLILWHPGQIPADRVVSEPVRATDVAPTLLDLVGAPPLNAPHGRSLVPLIVSSKPLEPAPIYAETYLPQLYLNWAPLRTVRDDRWKFIDAPSPELYDLSKDAGERENLYTAERQKAEAMQGALRHLTGGSEGAMNAVSVDRETSEKLAALGYIGAGAAAPSSTRNAGARDPKDMIGLFNQLRRANNAVRDRQFSVALPLLQDVLTKDPRNAFAQLVLGSAYMGMEQYPKAIAQYRKYVELVPTSSYAHQWMAICYLRLGDQENALRESAAALALDPRSTDSRILRGGILASRGQYDAALRELGAAVDADPAKPMVRLDLAKVLVEAGRTDEARREYERILGRTPDYAPALTGLGALHARQGQSEQAAALFRRALAIDPTNEGTRFNLARTLEQQGRREEAAAEYRKLMQDQQTSHALREEAATRLRGLTK